MTRLTRQTAVLLGLLVGALTAGEIDAQSTKKRGGPTPDLDGFKAQAFDYWKTPEKEKLEKPILNRFVLAAGKDYRADGEILIKELDEKESVKGAFDEVKKLVKPPDGKKIDEVSRESNVEPAKGGPVKITQLIVTNGTYSEDGSPKGKKIEGARVIAAVVESRDKKFLVRLVGPREMVSVTAADLDTFLKDLKK